MTQYSQRSWRLFGVFSFVVRKVRNSTARKLKRGRKRKRRGKGREEKTVRKTAFSLRRRRIPPPSLPNYRPLYSKRSLRASSLIEPRAELRKGLSLPQPPLSRLLSRASRESTFHDIPQMESLLAGYYVRSKTLAVYRVFYNLWRGILKVQKAFSNA